MKRELSYRLHADIMFYCETWAATSEDVALDGYQCFNKPRAFKHTKAGRCGGGLSFLVKNDIFNKYRVFNIDMGMDEIMYLRLVDKQCDSAISIFGLYIPPETSAFGQHVDIIYECIISTLYNC